MEKPPNSWRRNEKVKGGFQIPVLPTVRVSPAFRSDFTCLQNLTHSGVVGGGVRAFGPSLARISFALEEDRPYKVAGRKNFYFETRLLNLSLFSLATGELLLPPLFRKTKATTTTRKKKKKKRVILQLKR